IRPENVQSARGAWPGALFSLAVQSNSAVAEFDTLNAEIGHARFRMEGGRAQRGRAGTTDAAPLKRPHPTLSEDGEGQRKAAANRLSPNYASTSKSSRGVAHSTSTPLSVTTTASPSTTYPTSGW